MSQEPTILSDPIKASLPPGDYVAAAPLLNKDASVGLLTLSGVKRRPRSPSCGSFTVLLFSGFDAAAV